ncbi:MAG: hypothetical protein AAF628_36550 [Planctomycetota bacterium]
MVLHPTQGMTHGADEHGARRAAVAAVVHAVAVVSIALKVAGSLAVHRRLRTSAWADLGLVALVFGLLMAALAATTNGLAAPKLWSLIENASAPERQDVIATWRVMHEVADVATVVFFVGVAVAALVWGSVLLAHDRLCGVSGLVVGAIGLAATVLGALRPEVGPLLIFVTLYEVWVMTVAGRVLWPRADVAGARA